MSEGMGAKKREVGLFEVPDEILHNVFTFVANSPCLIGPSVCWNLRHLSKDWKNSLDTDRTDLWALATSDLECDSYCIGAAGGAVASTSSSKRKKTSKKRPTAAPASPSKRMKSDNDDLARRSTRLRASTPKESYIHAYNMTLSRTETALLQIAEWGQSPKDSLTFAKLRNTLLLHGPIAINQRVRTGGTFLVEVCRARHIYEGIILKCIKLLIEEYGANPNVPSAEFSSGKKITIQGQSTNNSDYSTSSVGTELYPLIIAGARGMSSVVKYLLESGADKTCRGSCRFKLFSNPKKSAKGENLTAYEFACKMLHEEKSNGIKNSDCKGLVKVIQLLDPMMGSRLTQFLTRR